jgi:hypothetical protein
MSWMSGGITNWFQKWMLVRQITLTLTAHVHLTICVDNSPNVTNVFCMLSDYKTLVRDYNEFITTEMTNSLIEWVSGESSPHTRTPDQFWTSTSERSSSKRFNLIFDNQNNPAIAWFTLNFGQKTPPSADAVSPFEATVFLCVLYSAVSGPIRVAREGYSPKVWRHHVNTAGSQTVLSNCVCAKLNGFDEFGVVGSKKKKKNVVIKLLILMLGITGIFKQI